MKILLLGATGRTGNIILRKAVKENYKVTVIVRDPLKIKDTEAEVIKGTPYDINTVKIAITGCDAVVCALNVSRMSDNPWAKLRAPKDLISKSIQNALAEMKKNEIKRIISLSALGAGDSKKKMPLIFNLFVSMSNLKYAYSDHSRQEEILSNSDANWTVIRLPMLTDEKGESDILVNKNDGVKLKKNINRDSVARFVLSILEDEIYFKKIVGISHG